MNKKQFKAEVTDQTYVGFNGKKVKINAFFFGYAQGEDISTGKTFRGYKYMVSGNVKDLNKAELLDAMYAWIENGTNLPWFINYKYAATDAQRFRVSLSLK